MKATEAKQKLFDLDNQEKEVQIKIGSDALITLTAKEARERIHAIPFPEYNTIEINLSV